MATSDVRPELPLVVIVGPTASGKTALAIKLAKKFDGEIICADSRTVYKDMDIGTAKPTKEEQAAVPHWGLDLVKPGQRFTAYDFKTYATNTLQDIRFREKVPFIVGGTGLYVDAVLFDFQFGSSNEQVTSNISCDKNIKLQLELPSRIMRTTHNDKIPSVASDWQVKHDNLIVVGIATEKNILRKQITARIDQLFESGVVNEATLVGKKYGWDNTAMTANIYPILRRYSRGELSLVDAKQACVTLDWRLAKRQLTWLRRNPHILWCSVDEAEQYIRGVLAEQ